MHKLFLHDVWEARETAYQVIKHDLFTCYTWFGRISLTNIHSRWQRELDHHHVVVQRVRGEEPKTARCFDNPNSDDRL